MNAPRARAATLSVLVTSFAVALLASRPDSPFTPFLHPDDRSPAFLRGLAGLLGLDALHRDVAAMVGAVLLIGAAVAFVFAAREAWRGRLSVRTVVLVGVALHVLAFVLPLFISRDVYSYAYYGRMVSVYGVNPYLSTPGQFLRDPFYLYVSHFWIDSPSVYGPAFSALAGGLTGLTSGVVATVKVFKLVAALASVGTMVLVVLAARRVRPERAAFAGLLVGWNPVIIFHNVAGGHNDALVGLAVAGAALLLLVRRDLWATAVLTLGALVKVSAVIPLLVLWVGSVAARGRGRRMRWAGAHALVAVLVALPFVIPFFSLQDPTMGQLELSSRQGWLAPSRFLVITLRGLVRSFAGDVGGDITSAVIRLLFPVLLGLALVGLGRHLARDPHRITPELVLGAMGWAILFGLMMSPILLPWYAAWMIPLAWILPRPARDGALFIAVALVITELMSEPTRSPRVWEVLVIWLHWVATPIVIGVLVRLLLEVRQRFRLGTSPGWEDPLLLEPPVLESRILNAVDRVIAGGRREQVAGAAERNRQGRPTGRGG